MLRKTIQKQSFFHRIRFLTFNTTGMMEKKPVHARKPYTIVWLLVWFMALEKEEMGWEALLPGLDWSLGWTGILIQHVQYSPTLIQVRKPVS